MRLLYASKTALRAMVRAPMLTATSVASLAAGLWLMGTVAMALEGGRSAVRTWAQGGSIACGIAADVPASSWQSLAQTVAAIPGVRSVSVLTPEASLALLQAPGAPTEALSRGLTADLVPASLLVTPTPGFFDEAALQAVSGAIAAIAGIDDVDYGALPLHRVEAGVRFATLAALALTASLAATLLVLLTSSIRLLLYARRDEVRILQLIGATKAFVRAPFLIEGVFSGLLAGAMAAALSRLGEHVAGPYLLAGTQALALPTALRLFSLTLASAQLAGGAAMGLVGSLVAVHAFLRDDAVA